MTLKKCYLSFTGFDYNFFNLIEHNLFKHLKIELLIIAKKYRDIKQNIPRIY